MRRAWLRIAFGAGLACLRALPVDAASAGIETPPGSDRPVRIIKRDAKFVFPAKLVPIGITSGEVRLFLNVDRRGELTDHLFVAFTHHEFANEVARTVPRWRYEPAIVDGRRVASTILLNVKFRLNGIVVTERRGFEDPPVLPGTFMFRARELRELDTVPRLIASAMPPNPVDDNEVPITGRARVDFYIDEDGVVRMPVVASADDERLGWVALAAIAQWRFETPRRGGHPVLARASQVFVFSLDG